MSPILALMSKIAGAPEKRESFGIKQSSYLAAELIHLAFNAMQRMPEELRHEAVKTAARELAKI